MKYDKTAKIAILMAAIILLSSLAAAPGSFTGGSGPTNISATLAYDDVDLSDAVTASGSNSVPAFKLTTPGKAIVLSTSAGAAINTNQLIFASRAGFRGVYYNDTEKHAYSGTSFTLNGILYTIERTANAYKFSSSQSGSLIIGAHASNTLILPDNGRNVKIVLASGERTETLPATVVFNSPVAGTDVSAAGERAAGAAGVSGEAPETASAGCVDADKDEDNPSIVQSYVTVISGETQTTIMDNCAVSGDVTRLYEAVCDGNTAKMEQVVCPESMLCPVGEGACRRNIDASAKFCNKTDPLIADTAAALIYSTTTKGIMMGSYAATMQTIEVSGETAEVGREFGAWADYCKDSKTLIEYYCTPGTEQRGAFREVICLNGCSDGKCETRPYCYDSDGGAYSSVKGTIRGVNASGQYFAKTDSCKDENTVIEYTCNPSTDRNPNGGPCQANEQCTSNFCDTQMQRFECAAVPVPAERKPNGQTCQANEQCTSNFCDTQMQRFECAAVPAGRLPNGQTCQANEQCTSNFCDTQMQRFECAAVPVPAERKPNGQTCQANEQCTSNFCDTQMQRFECAAVPARSDATYQANGFAVQEMPCGAGKYCNDGKCLSGTAPLCKACDPLNKFNIRQGTVCEGSTPTQWVLKRCPAGQYCNANNCIPELKTTIAQVTTAFNNRKQWALLLNETLGWIETARQITPIIEIAAGRYAAMEQIATGLSGAQMRLAQSRINPLGGAGAGFPGGPGFP